MTPEQIKAIREALRLKQTEFGNLFGVHTMTVSKWERGLLSPTPYQIALMTDFKKAAQSQQVKDTLGAVLIGAGIAAALYLLLKNSRN